MSKKIFSIKYDTNYPNGRIFDNEKQHTLYIDEVVNLLNWLNDENKELKQENEQLRKELDSFNPVMFQDMRKGTIRLYSKGGIDE